MQKKIHDEQKKSKTKDTFKASKGKLLVHQNLTESAKKKKKSFSILLPFPNTWVLLSTWLFSQTASTK